MKSSCVLLQWFLLVSALASFSNASVMRLRRDVSELTTPQPNYLPPPMFPEAIPETVAPQSPPGVALKTALDATSEIVPTDQSLQSVVNVAEPKESTVLGDNGYEYQTVRRLKYRHRNRRDVSHVPGVNNQYLAPVQRSTQSRVEREYVPPTETSEELQALQLKEAPQDTAVLADDGYHYKQPEVAMNLKMARTEMAYLPPINRDAVENVVVEGPMEGAILADDGYHYRVVKRFRF